MCLLTNGEPVNMSKENLGNIFEKSKAIDIIILLIEEETTTLTNLIKIVGGSTGTVYDRLDELSEANIITIKKKNKFPFTRTVQLTEKGKDIAAKLRRIRFETSGELTESARLIIYMIYSFGSSIHGTTRMEKLPFLLEKEGSIKLSYYYKPMTWGPYSIELLDELNFLQDQGYLNIIEETVEISNNAQEHKKVERKSYILTVQGLSKAKRIKKQLSEQDTQAIGKIKKYNDMPLEDLLDYVHTKYPSYQKKQI